MSKRHIYLTLALLTAAGVVFAVWSTLDLAVARSFAELGAFHGTDPALRSLRRVFYYGPIVCLLLPASFWLARQAGLKIPERLVPGGRTLAFLFLTLALGPGLLVNVILKEHSKRPRPVQVVEFGGSAQFRPWYTFDGACKSNCSFVSGEAATATWLIAPALVAPPPWPMIAVPAALMVAVATAALRMAFGGHFLSDVLFAVLLTILIVQALYRVIFRQ